MSSRLTRANLTPDADARPLRLDSNPAAPALPPKILQHRLQRPLRRIHGSCIALFSSFFCSFLSSFFSSFFSSFLHSHSYCHFILIVPVCSMAPGKFIETHPFPGIPGLIAGASSRGGETDKPRVVAGPRRRDAVKARKALGWGRLP